MGSDAIYCGCGLVAELVTGNELYPHRQDDLGDKLFYRCKPCAAWVGVNASTGLPMGSLANEETRKARKRAHEFMQTLIRRKMAREKIGEQRARQLAQAWISERLEIPKDRAKINLMDAATALRVAELCRPFAER